jgi:hypothetical protein
VSHALALRAERRATVGPSGLLALAPTPSAFFFFKEKILREEKRKKPTPSAFFFFFLRKIF